MISVIAEKTMDTTCGTNTVQYVMDLSRTLGNYLSEEELLRLAGLFQMALEDDGWKAKIKITTEVFI